MPHILYTVLFQTDAFVAHWRFMHFHGQKSTRQDRYKSIYKDNRRKRTILFQILSPILFFFPDVHLRELNKLWTDKIVVEALWKEFMEKLVSEWTGFVLYVCLQFPPLSPDIAHFDTGKSDSPQ